MKQKKLAIAIQAALFSLVVGNVSAEPLTAEAITSLDATSVGEVLAADIPTDLVDEFISQLATFDDLSSVSAEVAQLVIEKDNAEEPVLSEEQKTALQGTVDASATADADAPADADADATADADADATADADADATADTDADATADADADATADADADATADADADATADADADATADADADATADADADATADADADADTDATADADAEVVALTEEELKALTAETIVEISVEQIALLTVETVALLPAEILAGLTVEQAEGLSAEVLGALTEEQSAGLSPEVVASLSAGDESDSDDEDGSKDGDDSDGGDGSKDDDGSKDGSGDASEDGGDDADVSDLEGTDLLSIDLEKASTLNEEQLIKLTDSFDFASLMTLDLDELMGWMAKLDEENAAHAFLKIRFFAGLDIGQFEVKFEKKHGKQYAKMLEQFYKDFLPHGWKIHIKYTKEGRLEYKIKIGKHAKFGFNGLKFVTVKFAPVLTIQADAEEGETPEEAAASLADVPEDVLTELPDEEIASVPPELVGAASQTLKAKYTLSIIINNQMPTAEMMPTGWSLLEGGKIKPVTADLTGGLLANMKADQLKQLDQSVMGELSSEQLGQVNGEALCQLPDEYLNAIPEETVANLSDEAMGSIIFSINVEKANGNFFKKFKKPGWDVKFEGGKITLDLAPMAVLALPIQDIGAQIMWISPLSFAYFTSVQISLLTPPALGAVQPEQVTAISTEAVKGLSQWQVLAMSYNARLAFTLEQERATDVQLLPDSYPVAQTTDPFVDDGSLPPVEEPTDDAEEPVDDGEVPVDDAEEPEDIEEPVDAVEDTEEPVDGAEEPTDEEPVDGTEEPADEEPVAEDAVLPELGVGSAVDADGNPTETDAEFEGGVLVEGEAEPEVSLEDEVSVEGEIGVDSGHVGLVAEIVVFASFGADWYMLDASGAPILWESGTDGMPSTDGLVAFKTEITLEQTQSVKMYEGKFVYAGMLNIYYGYRITEGEGEGTVVFNEEPMDIEIVEGETAAEEVTDVADESAAEEVTDVADESAAEEVTDESAAEEVTDEPAAEEPATDAVVNG